MDDIQYIMKTHLFPAPADDSREAKFAKMYRKMLISFAETG